MGIWDYLRLFRDDRPVFSAGQETARRCESAVWERSARRLRGMTQAEARGYIRARARMIVGDHLDLVALGNPQFVAAHRKRILEVALDAIVVRVLELQRVHLAAERPAPALARRQAA